jgi:hypothetical protein
MRVGQRIEKNDISLKRYSVVTALQPPALRIEGSGQLRDVPSKEFIGEKVAGCCAVYRVRRREYW